MAFTSKSKVKESSEIFCNIPQIWPTPCWELEYFSTRTKSNPNHTKKILQYSIKYFVPHFRNQFGVDALEWTPYIWFYYQSCWMSMSYQETQKLYFFRKEMRARRRRRRRLVVVVCDAVKHWYGFGWLFFQVCVLWWWLYYNFHAPWTLSGTFLLLPGCFNTSPWLHWFYWGPYVVQDTMTLSLTTPSTQHQPSLQ